jgi:hypothetical protein
MIVSSFNDLKMKIIIPNATLKRFPSTNQVRTIIFMTNEFGGFILLILDISMGCRKFNHFETHTFDLSS